MKERFGFLDDETEKVNALNDIMGHYSESGDWDFDSSMIGKILVFEVRINNISVKRSGS